MTDPRPVEKKKKKRQKRSMGGSPSTCSDRLVIIIIIITTHSIEFWHQIIIIVARDFTLLRIRASSVVLLDHLHQLSFDKNARRFFRGFFFPLPLPLPLPLPPLLPRSSSLPRLPSLHFIPRRSLPKKPRASSRCRPVARDRVFRRLANISDARAIAHGCPFSKYF